MSSVGGPYYKPGLAPLPVRCKYCQRVIVNKQESLDSKRPVWCGSDGRNGCEHAPGFYEAHKPVGEREPLSREFKAAHFDDIEDLLLQAYQEALDTPGGMPDWAEEAEELLRKTGALS